MQAVAALLMIGAMACCVVSGMASERDDRGGAGTMLLAGFLCAVLAFVVFAMWGCRP